MKNKYLVVGLLAMVLAIGAMCFIGANDDVAYAADNNVSAVELDDVDYIVEQHTNISAYRNTNGNTSPSIEKTETTGEWVFAGWYEDAACSEAVKKSSGEAYAKFVSADVLSVKCQISTDTTAESDSTLLRCISSVDTLKYSFVGFDLITPTVQKNMESSKVGTRIQVTEDKKSNPCNYSPKVVDTESEYFFSAVETINKEDFANGFLIKPYWITKDGTKVYGVSKYVTISDALNKTAIYIPVKKSTEPTGTFTVKGNTADCVKYDADGDYAHLKYTGTISDSVTKLEVTGGDANATIYYRNLNTKYTGSNADQSWYSAYSDTAEDEFVIATSADLYGLTSTEETFDGKTIYLCADIEANKGKATADGWDKTQVAEGTEGTDFGWTPIPTVFNGTFNGQGHTISGINVNRTSDRAGLFAWTNKNSVIQNFSLLNSYIKTTGAYAGSVVGRVDGKISKVYSDAFVSGNYCNGGIAGNVYSESGNVQIENCHFAGSVSSQGNVAGGIVGTQYNAKAIITNCIVSGQVNAGLQYVGGIYGTSYKTSFGEQVDVEITGCTVKDTASITASGNNTGGLVGYIAKGNLNITSSSFGGNLPTSVGLKGGLVGHVVDGTVDINDSSFVGNMAATNWSGGFVGQVEGGEVTIQQSNSNGTIEATSTQLGGLVGYVKGGKVTIQQSNFAGDLEAYQSTGGLVGQVEGGTVTIDESSFKTTGKLTAGWAVGGLVGRVKDGTVNIQNNSSFAGELTGTDIFTGGLIGYVENGTVNIDNSSFETTGNLTGKAYTGGVVGRVANGDVTIQESASNGTINVISGDNAGGFVGDIVDGELTINENSSFGGALTSAGGVHGGFVGGASGGTTLIENCSSTTGATVTASSYNQTGGLVGYVSTGTVTINNSSFAGTLNANNYAGGLVGRVVSGTVNIENKSSFTGVLNAKQYAGGFAGIVEGGTVNVTDSSAAGTVASTGYAGGIVGQEKGGTVNIINNSSFVGMLNTTGQYIGGLVGDKSGGDITIQDCYSSATFSAKDWYAGGLVGAISGGTNTTIENSYFSGNLTGTFFAGGILGVMNSSNTINIKKCYSSGTVTGSGGNGIGGILGYITSGTVNMENCLNKGSVTTNDGGAGGLVGRTNGGTVSINYCLNRGTIEGPHLIGSVVGWKQSGTVSATNVYATETSTATAVGVSGKYPYSNVPIGGSNSATYEGVTMIGLTGITVSNENNVTADSVKTTLTGFNFDTIWTIGETEGSMPELNLTK